MQRPTAAEVQAGSSDSDNNERVWLECLGDASVKRVLHQSSTKSLLGSGKSFAVLAYLVLSPNRTASRDRLVDLLWADLEPEDGRHQLRNALSLIRSRLGKWALKTDDRAACTLSMSVEADVTQFRRSFEEGDFKQALALYKGSFLEGFSAPGATEFELWAEGERAHFRSLAITAADMSCQAAIEEGRFADARAAAIRLRTIHPESEFAWRRLLEALMAGGDTIAALAEVERFDQWLRSNTDLPEPASITVIRQVRTAAVASKATQIDQRTLMADLVARETEFRAVLSAWSRARDGKQQVVLLMGAAGLGKSRLIADVAARLRFHRQCVALVRAYPGDRDIPYAFLITLIRALTQLPGALGVNERIVPTIISVDPRLADIYRSAETARGPSGDVVLHRSIAVQELVRAIAEDQPLAVFIDDEHWIDESSRQVLMHAFSHLKGIRVMLALASRSTLPSDWGYDASIATRLLLSPLSPGDVRALVASIGELPEEEGALETLIESIAKTSRGVPLFVLDALEQLVSEGALTLVERRWRIPDCSRLGDGISRLDPIAARIRALRPLEQVSVLKYAIAGVPLPRSLEASLFPNDGEREAIQRLEQLGLLRESTAGIEVAHDSIADKVVELSSATARLDASRDLGVALGDNDEQRWIETGLRQLASIRAVDELAKPLSKLAQLNREDARSNPRRFVASALGAKGDDPIVDRALRLLPASIRVHRLWRLAALFVSTAAVIAALFVAFHALPTDRPESILEVVLPNGSGKTRTALVPLFRTGWVETAPLPTHFERERIDSLARPVNGAVIHPYLDAWAIEAKSPDTRGNDIFLVARDGTRRRLTHSAADNKPDGWSPDGRQLAIATSASSPTGFKMLGIVDTATGAIRQVGRTEASQEAFWSPDGTRIVYGTSPLGIPSNKLCITSVSGREIACAKPGRSPVFPLGWVSDTRVLASVGTGKQLELVELDVATGDFAILPAGNTTDWKLSPDGLWLVSRGKETNRSTVYVAPSDRPHLTRRLADSVPGNALLTWKRGAAVSEYLDTLFITAPSDSLPFGAPFLLQVAGKSNLGRSIPVHVLQWTSLDSSVAAVDSLGQLHPKKEGSVVVELSAGGWRTTRRRFWIRKDSTKIVFSEAWTEGINSNWQSFGDPPPKTVIDSLLGHAFLNAGDGDYFSGAYLRRWIDGRRGVALDFVLRAWITRPQGQYLEVGFRSTTGLAASLQRWDHRTGYLDAGGQLSAACAANYPGHEGLAGAQELGSVGSLKRRAGDSLPSTARGVPLQVRLQILPDGRCGTAVTGLRPVITPGRFMTLDSLLVLLQGNSVATNMLIGRLTITNGIPGGVDWSSARDIP